MPLIIDGKVLPLLSSVVFADIHFIGTSDVIRVIPDHTLSSGLIATRNSGPKVKQVRIIVGNYEAIEFEPTPYVRMRYDAGLLWIRTEVNSIFFLHTPDGVVVDGKTAVTRNWVTFQRPELLSLRSWIVAPAFAWDVRIQL